MLLSGADVRLVRDADGRTSWTPGTVEAVAEETGQAAEEVADEAAEPDGGELTLPTVRELRVEDSSVVWDDAITGTEAELGVEATGSTLPEATPLAVAVDGTANGAPVEATFELESPIAEAISGAPVRLAADASIGGADVALSGTVGELATLAGTDLALDLDIDSLDALETALGTELPPLAPATLAATLRTEGEDLVLAAEGAVDGEPVSVSAALDLASPLPEALAGSEPVAIDAKATLGGATVGLVGRVGDPASLGEVDLALEADVRSLDAVRALTGAELPELAPATLSATLRSRQGGEGYTVDVDGSAAGEPVAARLDLDASLEDLRAGGPVGLDLDASVGGASVAASGRIEELATLGGADLQIEADVESLDGLEGLLGTELAAFDRASLSGTLTSGPEGRGYEVRAAGEVDGEAIDAALDLDATIDEALAGEPVGIDLDASVGGASVTASGTVDDVRSLAGADLEVDLELDSLAALERLTGVELPEIEPANLETTLRTGEGGETVLEANGTVAGEPADVRLELGTPIEEALAGGPVELDLDAAVGGAELALSGRVEDPRRLGGLDLELEADVESLDAIEALAGVELPELEPATLSATVRSEGSDTVLDAEGTVGGAPVAATLALDAPLEGVLAGGPVGIDLDASVGGASVSLDGRVADPLALSGVDLELAADVDSLDAIETLLGTELPDVGPATLDATLLTEGSEYVVRGLDLEAAGSTLAGDVRLDPTTGPPTVYANLASERLDVDAALGALGLDDETEEVADGAVEDEAAEGGDGPVLSDEPLPFDALFGSVQGAVALDVDELVYAPVPLEAIDARVELDPSRARIEIAEAVLAGGEVDGTAELEPTDGGAGIDARLELELARVRVGRFVPDVEIADDLGGPLGGQVELWASGNSVAALAGSLDGGASLLMGRGELDAVLVELAGLDLFQSIGDVLSPGEEEFRLRCAYASLLADAGVVTVDELAIDSTDTVFLARGTVDLGAEAFDLALEPHPKDPSLLSANTGVAIGGTFASPAIEVGSELPARAAAAAALAVVATPAAALLPFIGTGGGEDSGFCELEGALDGDAG